MIMVSFIFSLCPVQTIFMLLSSFCRFHLRKWVLVSKVVRLWKYSRFAIHRGQTSYFFMFWYRLQSLTTNDKKKTTNSEKKNKNKKSIKKPIRYHVYHWSIIQRKCLCLCHRIKVNPKNQHFNSNAATATATMWKGTKLFHLPQLYMFHFDFSMLTYSFDTPGPGVMCLCVYISFILRWLFVLFSLFTFSFVSHIYGYGFPLAGNEMFNCTFFLNDEFAICHF